MAFHERTRSQEQRPEPLGVLGVGRGGRELGDDDGDVLPRLLRQGGGGRTKIECRIAREDLTLEELQWRAGIEAELLARDLASILVGVQRVRLPTRPIEREHELTPQSLAKGLRAYPALEFGDELGVVP